MSKKTIFFSLLMILCLCLGAGSQAAGYVLDGRHVLELMLARMNPADRVQMEQTLTLFDERFEGGHLAVSQRVSCKMPARFRSEIQTEKLSRIYVASEGESLTIVDGKIVSEAGNLAHRYMELFCWPDRDALADHLRFMGMDVALSSYGRCGKEPVYVIGARYPEKSSPQLWVDKDSLLPVRWILTAAENTGQQESFAFHFENWQKSSGSLYPGLIQLFKNGSLVRRIEIHSITANPALPSKLFDIAHLKAVYTESAQAPGQSGTESDLDRQIQQFRNIFDTQ
ncbi:MAG: hypothetical protein R6X08_08455 [Desulfosalsimonadaceae bacterium]